jgi:hypothetical protein
MIDFSLDKLRAAQNTEINLILQQIELLFDTTQKDVLGYEEFGSQYDKYLYKLNITADNLKQRVLADLNSLELFGFKPTVEVYLCQGTEKDIALIEIDLIKNQEHYKQTYRIS